MAAVFMHTADVRSADLSLDGAFREGNGIYMPGQSVILDVILRNNPNNNVSDALDLQAVLSHLSSPDSPSIGVFGTKLPPNVPLPISFVTPDKEGVYEIKIIVTQTVRQHPFPNVSVPRLAAPVYVAQTIAEVRRQFVVLSPQPVSRSAGSWTLSETRDLLAVADDSPTRRQLLPFPRMPELPKISDLPRPVNLLNVSPFGRRNSTAQSGETHGEVSDEPPWWYDKRFIILPVVQGQFLEKSEKNPHFSALAAAQIGDCTWFSLPIETLSGTPYLVEIDYPGNIPQTLGVAVVDYLLPWEQQLNRLGQINTAAAIHVAEEIVQDASVETTATHQILFWATTNQPELILINRQPNQEALFRNVRISRVTIPEQQEDQRLPKLFEGEAQRKRIGQLLGHYHLVDTPPNNPEFMAEYLNDWQKPYERCSRLIDKLHRGGYDGVTLTVLSKKASLYPTTSGTLKYLEMIFQRFNSEELTLIPAIQFDILIPALEQLLQQHPGVTEEVLIGDSRDRQYNVLHPAVQQAMTEIILDLVNRFGHHPSFGGVAVVLSPETYAQLPFALYPPDDYTFAQFRQETERELGVPFPDEQRMRQTMPMQQFLEQKNTGRIQFLQSNPQIWETWVRWRATKVSGFYANQARHISTGRRDVPLYLLGGTMLDSPEIGQFCTPTLPRNFTPLQAMQLLGFDLRLLSKAESVHFLRPARIAETKNYRYDRLNSADAAPLFIESGSISGVQFVHSGGTADGSLDHFVTVPAGVQSRRRFVQQLAQADVSMFMEGGVSPPSGQESAMFDLLNTYRRLPPVPFQTFQSAGESAPSLQPLTVRYKQLPEGMIVYIVNDAPFAVEADFVFTAAPRSTITELTGHRMIRSLSNMQRSGSYTWRVSLLPYDLLAVKISDVNADIESVVAHRPSGLCGAEGAFTQKVEELAQRIHAARSGVRWEGLVNMDFEIPSDTVGGILGWQCYGNALTAQIDFDNACQGRSSIKLTNRSAETGTFLCQPLESLPATGRLDVAMFVGVPEDSLSLPMNVLLTAKHRDQPFHRIVPVGETLMSALVRVQPKNGVRWHRLSVPFRYLPESLKEVRIGVQYAGHGTVWLDDVTLYPVLFSAAELGELQRILLVANERRKGDRYSDLLSLFEGHWSQFVFCHVPALVPQPSVSAPSPPVARESAPPPKSPSLYQRVRGLFGSE